MLLTSIILMVVGYTMVYSALHGKWNFWIFFFPQNPVKASAVAAPAAPAQAA